MPHLSNWHHVPRLAYKCNKILAEQSSWWPALKVSQRENKRTHKLSWHGFIPMIHTERKKKRVCMFPGTCLLGGKNCTSTILQVSILFTENASQANMFRVPSVTEISHKCHPTSCPISWTINTGDEKTWVCLLNLSTKGFSAQVKTKQWNNCRRKQSGINE